MNVNNRIVRIEKIKPFARCSDINDASIYSYLLGIARFVYPAILTHKSSRSVGQKTVTA